MTKPPHHLICATLVFFACASCKTPTVTFQADTGTGIALKKLGDFSDLGEEIGINSPQSMDKFKGKMVQVSSSELPSSYWIFYPSPNGNLNIRLNDPSAAISKERSSTNPHFLPRLVFMCARALDSGNKALAIQLADQMTSIYPHIATPWIIKGLIRSADGNASEAKAFFSRAKALDPSDKELDKLISEVR